MKEQDLPEAGFWEKAVVRSLLWLEKHLEQKVAPIDQGRKWPLGRKMRWGLGTVSAGSSVVLLLNFLGGIHDGPTNITIPDISLVQAQDSGEIQGSSEDYYSADWQRNPDIISLIRAAKQEKRLTLVENERSLIKTPLVFTQKSNSVILAIDKNALSAWLAKQKPTHETIQLTFKDVSITPPSMSLIDFEFSLIDIWRTEVPGKTPQDLLTNFSYAISSEVAAQTEFIITNGSFELMRQRLYPLNIPGLAVVRQRAQWYEQQFKSNRLKPFIQIKAVNPIWVEEKLNQSQRP